MASPDLKIIEEIVTLSSLAVDAVTRWDDVTEKFDDIPGLLTVLEISQAEVDQVSNFLRKVTDKVHDRKNDKLRALERLLRSIPAPAEGQAAMSRMWEEAEANHPGPRVLESVLLPGLPPQSDTTSEAALA